MSIKKLAIRGAVWTLIGYGASQVLRFGSNLVLTRLLFPELFGLMALVNVFITGLHLFSDLGLNASIVQNRRGDDPAFLNTAWTLQVLRGVVLWLGCFAIAYPASLFYREPRLLWLIPIVGLNTIVSGFNATSLATLNRHLSVKTQALYELSTQIFSTAAILIWAWFDPSIWAIVAGGFVAALYQLCLSHKLNGKMHNHFAWDKSAVKELISFGKWIFLSTAIYFLAFQSDRLLMGRFFTLELLGVYGVALALAEVPRSIVSAISTKVLYPVYSKMADLPRFEFRAKVVRNRWLLGAVMAVGVAITVGLGDLLISFLYDNRYNAAAWMFPMLALGLWPLILVQTINQGLWAFGKPNYETFGTFFSFLCYLIGIPLGYLSPLREVGAILAVAVSNIPIWIAVSYGLWREKLLAFRQDLFITALFLIVLLLVILVRISLGFGSPFDGIFMHLTVK